MWLFDKKTAFKNNEIFFKICDVFDFQKINVDLTKTIVEIAKKTHSKKIIYLSGLGVTSKPTITYFKSKYLAEQVIIKSGISYVLFRPSYIIGKNDYLTKNLTSQIKSGKIVIPGSGKYHIQPIRIEDVCKIIHQSLNDKKFLSKSILCIKPQSKNTFFIIHWFPPPSTNVTYILQECHIAKMKLSLTHQNNS